VTHLGELPIRNEDSVCDARQKVKAVAEALSGDMVAATRAATAVSEIARLYLQEGSRPKLEMSFEPSGHEASLCLGFVDVSIAPDLGHLAGFFDSTEFRRSGDGHVTQRVIMGLGSIVDPARKLIEELRALVQKKSRDELLGEIRDKNAELEESLENLRRTRSVKDRMESELNIGRDIQMSMLPLSFPAFPHRDDFDIHAALHPAREVGGDFYDLFLIDDDHFCFCVGDVSGKGVPAALFMAVTKTLIKSRAANDLSPASILSHVNTELAHRNESCMFVTIFLGILDLGRGRLMFSNAGHNPPYVVRPGGELVRLDQRHGPIVGAAEGLAYKQSEIELEVGDLLFLYTDGVTEAMNEAKELYSEDRLRRLLGSKTLRSAKDAVELGVEDVRTFEAGAEQADDVTVLSVTYLRSSAEGEDGHLAIEAKNRLDEIARVNDEFNAFAEAHEIDTKVRRSLNLVFDELMNNTISYGYDDEGEHEIHVVLRLKGGVLHVTISDDGTPFNPFDISAPDTTLSLEERPIGGLGVHLVRSVMDEVSYQRKGERNVITMSMRVSAGKEQA
jgi:sigma-B regulation protein RsbU (phosphoserine phosphatase)